MFFTSCHRARSKDLVLFVLWISKNEVQCYKGRNLARRLIVGITIVALKGSKMGGESSNRSRLVLVLTGAFEGQLSLLILAIRLAALGGQVSSSEVLCLCVQFKIDEG
jgi:hypothetical protein